MNHFLSKLMSLVGVASLCAACAGAPATDSAGRYDAIKAEIAALAQKEMKANKVVSLVITLVDDQDTVWEQGFGYSNLEARVPVTPDTTFCIGSVSKLFTATAIMRLAEEGKIALDAPLVDSLPEFGVRTRSPDAGPITIRHLLTHHSGLGSDFLALALRPSLGRDRWFSQTLRLLKDEYVANPPGLLYSYSNIGFDLLGSVIEKASGMSFEPYMQEQILAPAGMRSASFTSRSLDQESMALAYAAGKPNKDLSIDGDPAGGLWGSARDLACFMKMVLADGMSPSGRILRPETMAEMLRPQNADVPMDLDVRTGLAWKLDEIAGSLTAGHNGDARCYHSSLLIQPEEKLGVFVTSGSDESSPLVSRLAMTTLKRALEAKTGKVEQAPTKESQETVRLSAEDLGGFPGVYATEEGLVTVTARRNNLWLRMHGNELKLIPRPGRRFSLQFLLFGFIPFMLPGLDSAPQFGYSTVQGHALVVATTEGKSRVMGEKIRPVPIPEAWMKRIGKWAPVNANGTSDPMQFVTLRREGEFLLFDIVIGDSTAAVWALSPLGDGEAVIAGIGRYMGETIRVKTSGGEESLMFSGYEFRRRAS